MLGTSRRQRREAAARRRRSKVCTSGGRGRGHLARKARLSFVVVVVVVVVVVWCTKLNVLSKDMIWVFQCRGRNPLHSSYLRSLSLCIVVSFLTTRQKNALSSLGLFDVVVFVVVGAAAKKSRRLQKTTVVVVVVEFGRRRVRAHLGVLLCVSFFLSFSLSLSRILRCNVVPIWSVFQRKTREFVGGVVALGADLFSFASSSFTSSSIIIIIIGTTDNTQQQRRDSN